MASIAQKVLGGVLNVASSVAAVAGKPGLAAVTSNLAGKLTGSSSPIKASSTQTAPAASTPAKASAQNLVAGAPGASASTPQKSSADSKDPLKIIGGLTGKTDKTQMTWAIIIGVFIVILAAIFGGGTRKLKKLFR